MRIIHIIPGIDPGASERLAMEHELAVQSASIAAHRFSCKQHSLRVCRVVDRGWPVSDKPKVDTFINRVEVVSVGHGGGLRPRLKSFMPDELVSKYDLVIFTNSDICLYPDFYESVLDLVNSGTLAGSIHRRTVIGVDPREPNALSTAQSSPNWYLHKGSDCFFFPSDSSRVFRNNLLYMGVPPVGKSIAFALSAHNPSYKTLRSLGITFHFGNDKVWQTSAALQKLRVRNNLYWFFHLVLTLRSSGVSGFMRGLETVGHPGKFMFSLVPARMLFAFVKLMGHLRQFLT